MVSSQLQIPDNMPNIWGHGQLFAFSAIDGQTNCKEPFVLHTGVKAGSLAVKLPIEAEINFDNLGTLDFKIILGDVIIADSVNGRFIIAFCDDHILTGQMPAKAKMVINGTTIGSEPVVIGQKDNLTLSAVSKDERFAIVLSTDDKKPDFVSAFAVDVCNTANARSAYVRNLKIPTNLDAKKQRLLRKAVSVMKLNVESACGRIKRRWTTPDRWPHRYMWLWDSAFHTVGFCRIDLDVAKDATLAILEQANDDGMIPHMIGPETRSAMTQPPILSWAVLEVLNATNDKDWAAKCKPYLFNYLEWDRKNRDQNENYLPEWVIEYNPLCRCGECGLDNSPRFDRAIPLDAVDFASLLCNDYKCLGQIAEKLGDIEMQEVCLKHANNISNAVNKMLFCREEGFYLDKDFDGNFIDVKAVSGFFPFFAGIASVEHADALRQHLNNPATFDTAMPIPSVSVDSGTFCKDMWRGPTWLNVTYLVYRGLMNYGFVKEAQKIRDILIGKVNKWYEAEGCIFEYYDSLDLTSPHKLDRKQRLTTGKGYGPISDYHWSAVVTALLISDSSKE
ncbi:MAG: trehalase family glycosidase [Planctomycetota bacterium]